ncbi:MAG TPA: rod shape-determining protein MreC, partial [Flavisolibacter sp.]|nr:rod shape-determining protein MreC [Flavisolibacter sp.]
MRNIFLFVRRYITFLTFIVLQLIAIWMLFKYNRFHHSIGLGIASEFTGSINKQVDKLDDYFHQSEENKRVHRMNDSLMNLLKINFSQTDTALKIVTDSLLVDSTKMVRRYLYREAKVVYNTVNVERNYMQINRGSKYGIKDNMAVLNSDGAAAGVVVNVSNNFSEVMSLLHIQNSVSGALKKTGDAGKIEWDGKDPKIVLLRGVS